MPKTILLTGATGKTGAHTVPLLLGRGDRVRAFVHRADERSAALADSGAQVVVGDLLDLYALAEAMEGIESAYFCYPIEPGLVESAAYFAQAARENGVGAIVNMSQISARREAKSNAARQHWITEQMFDWSGVPTTHLRPTFFAEWLTLFAESIGRDGVLALPFGEGRHAPIAAEDQAHVIAAILADPVPHAGQVYPLFGPTEMDHHGIAAEVGRTLGRPVRYEPLEIEEFRDRMTRFRGAQPHVVQHIASVAVDYREGRFAGTNDVVARVGNTTPTTVERFVERHRNEFERREDAEAAAPA